MENTFADSWSKEKDISICKGLVRRDDDVIVGVVEARVGWEPNLVVSKLD